MLSFFFFFFKQKTAYEIVSGDWSSDVCSSDLVPGVVATRRPEERVGRWISAGEEVVRLFEPDSVDLVVVLERAGATLVRRGQVAALFARVGAGHSLEAHVTSVAAAATEQGLVEARIRVAGV